MDSEADPADNVRHAIELGLAGLTFTEHFDTHPSEWPACRYKYEEIAQTVSDLRREFGANLFIGHGIEVCYQPDQVETILAYLSAHQFDLVILSVHWFDGRALHIREHWDGLDETTGTRAYLETVLKAAHFVRDLKARGKNCFDVLGHLDLVKRYTQRFFGHYDIQSHEDVVDDILRVCLDADLVPEVNTSTLRQGLDEAMPADWVVARYAALGGSAMSLGSDAHAPGDVGAGLADGATMLKRQGISNLAVFNERRRHDEPL